MPRPLPADALALAALGTAVGAALVLDGELRIEGCTPAAAALLGFEPPRGERAVRVLCGTRPERPVADALAAGRPVQAVVPSPRGGATVWLRVRAMPLPQVGEGGAPPPGARAGGRRGWLLLLDAAGPADAEGPVEFEGFLTADPRTKQVLRVVERVARTEATVLVRGETGAGKELIARALHARSPRASGPFRAINCAALPATLLDSELFGHARGAFTGAVRDVPGHVQVAHGGTLFLDEVAEMPLELQAKLLRMLETRTVIPVGARTPVPVDVRIVSATHRSLRREVEVGRFRADLMFRLRVVPLHLPPLRERPTDVALLVDRWVAELSGRGGRVVERVAPSALAALQRHDWPGNARELRNVLEYAFSVGEGPVLGLADLPPEVGEPGGGQTAGVPSAPPGGGTSEAQRLLAALERAGGRRARAAQILGMNRVTLWRKLRELHLEPPGPPPRGAGAVTPPE